MDLQMPDMDGYEATRYIRSQFESPVSTIPIIALTASVLRNDIEKCLQAGMNSYIAKPFKASELIAGIASVLNLGIPTIFQKKKEQKKSSDMVTNLDYLNTFCEGNTARMQKYIGMFTKSAPDLIQKIQSALLTNDYEEIANQVHSARTRLVMMGMEDSKYLSIEIEKFCRDANLPVKPIESIQHLLDQIQKANEELGMYMGGK